MYESRRALVEGIITFTVEKKEKKEKKQITVFEDEEGDPNGLNNLDGSKICFQSRHCIIEEIILNSLHIIFISSSWCFFYNS